MFTQLSVTPPVPLEFTQLTPASSHTIMSSSVTPPARLESTIDIEPYTSIGPVLSIVAPSNEQIP